MNNSRMTAIVAQGISLWAAVQDMPDNKLGGSPEQGAWIEWAVRYPELAELAKKEQYELFDRLLLYFHGDS